MATITDSGFAELWMQREDRWSIITAFLADWHTPLKPEDGLVPEAVDKAELALAAPIPLALREWYGMAGKRDDLFVQDTLLAPEVLYIVHDYLVFFTENQCVVAWGVRREDCAKTDPPVWMDEDAAWGHSNKWVRQNSTLSEFLLQRLIAEAPYWAPWGTSGFLDAPAADRVEEQLEDLGLPYCRWPSDPTKHFAGPGLLVQICPHRGGGFVSAAAASEQAMQSAKAVLPIQWERGPRAIPK